MNCPIAATIAAASSSDGDGAIEDTAGRAPAIRTL
jgi:hypothetical protein